MSVLHVPRRLVAVVAAVILIVGQTVVASVAWAVDGPDLAITKTGPVTLVSGSPASYTLAVTNVGTVLAPGPVVVTDNLPVGLTYVSATGSGWSCSFSTPTVTCTTPGPVAPSAALPPITLTVMVGGAGTTVPAVIENCADVAGGISATGAPADVNPQNNRSCATSQVTTTQQPGTLCIVKFNDLNGNGVRDPGEPTLAGWTFTITKPDGTTVNLTTNADGRICLDLPAGTYTVTEVLQAGWTQTAPVPVGPQVVTVTSGTTTTVVFGNHKGQEQGPCCLTFVFGAGKKDNFSTADGVTAEPVVAAPAPPTTTQLYFDGTTLGRTFSDRIQLPLGNCISSATYTIALKPLDSRKAGSDVIVLKIPGSGGMTWAKSINALSLATAPSYPWLPGKPAKTFTWNLAAMPLGGANMLPALQSKRVLDTYVRSNTSVDYIRLTIVFCQCTPGTAVPASGS